MLVGVDVGGTNTDAVLMDGTALVGAVKRPTTADVTSGIREALREALRHLPPGRQVGAVMVGTTHLTNALLERKRLAPTAVLRLALPATESLPPLVDWPAELRDALGARNFMVRGGHEFDGREISPLDEGGIRSALGAMRAGAVGQGTPDDSLDLQETQRACVTALRAKVVRERLVLGHGYS